MSLTVKHIAALLAVPNVEATAHYYRDKLGFTLNFYAPGSDISAYAEVERDGNIVHMMEGEKVDPPGTRGGLYIIVEDVDAVYDDLVKRGAFSNTFPKQYDAIREHPPETKQYGMRDLIMVDPNGYLVTFGQPI